MRKRSEVQAPAPKEVEALDEVTPSVEEYDPLGNARNVNAALETPFHPGFLRIVETILVKDPWALYEELQGWLQGKESRTTRDLDDVEFKARRAHDLWMTARQERLRWEVSNRVVFAAIRERAHQELQREKAAGQRAKIITDEDVETRCALDYPDEWTAQALRHGQVKRVEESMANLAGMFEQKCRNLAVVVSKQR